MNRCSLHIIHSFEPTKKIEIEFEQEFPELETVEEAAVLFKAICDQYKLTPRNSVLVVGVQIYWIRQKRDRKNYQFWRLE